MIPFLREAVTQLFSKPSTEGYPFVPKEAPVGYRGRIVFHADKCISCGMCERVCAGGAISTTSVETEEGQLITRKFFLGSCTFCNTCADFCVKHAIELTQDYHMVARCEDDLVVTGTYLKKKPVKKAPPAARRLNPPPRVPSPETTACPSTTRQSASTARSVPRNAPPGRSPWTAPPRLGPSTRTSASPAAPATTSAPRSALLCKPKSH